MHRKIRRNDCVVFLILRGEQVDTGYILRLFGRAAHRLERKRLGVSEIAVKRRVYWVDEVRDMQAIIHGLGDLPMLTHCLEEDCVRGDERTATASVFCGSRETTSRAS